MVFPTMNISNSNKINKSSDTTDKSIKFQVAAKEKSVADKKAFQTHIDPKILMDIDRIASRTGHSRNEMVVKMLEFCVNNIEYI